MCEDEGNKSGHGTAEAARCGIDGKGKGGLCQWFRWGRVNDTGDGSEGDMSEGDGS